MLNPLPFQLVMVVDARDPLFYRCPDLEVRNFLLVWAILALYNRKMGAANIPHIEVADVSMTSLYEISWAN